MIKVAVPARLIQRKTSTKVFSVEIGRVFIVCYVGRLLYFLASTIFYLNSLMWVKFVGQIVDYPVVKNG